MPSGKPTAVDAADPDVERDDLDDKPFEIRRKFRGRVYVFREPTARTYNRTVKAATVKEQLPEGGEIDRVDQDLLTQLLRAKVLVEPKLSTDEVEDLPAKVYFALNRATNEILYDPEEDQLAKEEAAKRAKRKADEEDGHSGN